MDIKSDLIDQITAFLTESGMAESTFGQRAVRDWRFVERLREGRVTVTLVERAQAYMADWRQRKAAEGAVKAAPDAAPAVPGPAIEAGGEAA